ncbi:unnamed protein product, partial [Ascophyllum nodosum]
MNTAAAGSGNQDPSSQLLERIADFWRRPAEGRRETRGRRGWGGGKAFGGVTSSAATMRTTRRFSMWLAFGILVLGLRGVQGQRNGGGRGNRGSSDTSEEDLLNSVLCAEDGTNAHYEEFLSGSEATTERWAGSITGCPNHVNWAINPNDALHNPTNASIPAYPMLLGAGGARNLSSEPNAIGIMRNGVALFSAWAVSTVTTYETTAFSLESSTFDMCGGHATALGIYHYHSTPGCLQEQAMEETGHNASQHSPLLGWSYDGFPVYGQLGPGGVEMKMCGENGADATHCLDVCNGYEAELTGVDEFEYRYYLSCGFDESYFPLTVNCYRGCCPDGMTCSTKVEPCDEDAVDGYTADYVPVSYPPLAIAFDAGFIEGNDTLHIGSKDSVDCALYAANATLGATPAPSVVTPAPSVVTPTVGGATPSPSAATEAVTVAPEAATTPAPSESPDEGKSGVIPRSSRPPLGMLLFMAAC